MRATLIRLRSADGLMEMNEDVRIGKSYEVIPGTERVVTLFNTKTGQVHEKTMILCTDYSLLPVELLRIESPA